MKRKHLLILALMIMAATNVATAQSAVPDLINYQGYVTDAAGNPLGTGSPVNLTVDFKFFYNATGGSAVYGERQTVTINEGDFSVLIGGGDPVPGLDNLVALGEVFAVKDVFLEITIDQDDNGLQDDSPITPRQQIVTTAYAFRAKVAERVDDLAITEDMMAASSITTAKLGSGAVTTDKIIGSAVISTSIADGSVEMVDLADNSVSTAKLQADAVNGSKVADGSLTGADIQDSSLTTNDIAANTLTSDDYEDGSVTRHTLGSGAVQTAYTDELVMLRGTFNASGATILASTGLTCTWIGTGTYRLDYPGIFNGNPTVVASSHGTYSHDNMLSSYAQGPNACIVRVTDGGSNGGSLQNGEFNVILVGPGN